jgi:hypothetical protein
LGTEEFWRDGKRELTYEIPTLYFPGTPSKFMVGVEIGVENSEKNDLVVALVPTVEAGYKQQIFFPTSRAGIFFIEKGWEYYSSRIRTRR